MAITVFTSIAIILLLSFSVTRRRLHLFEGIIVWAFLLHIHNNLIGIAGMDFGLILLSTRPDLYAAYCMIRTFIVPIMIFLFLEMNVTVSGIWRRLLGWGVFIHLFLLIQYIAERLDIVRHGEKWNVGWSYVMWGGIMLLTYAFHKWIRQLARKEVNI